MCTYMYVLEKEMATRSGILAWRIPWTEEPGGLQSMGSHESDTTERLLTHTRMYKMATLKEVLELGHIYFHNIFFLGRNVLTSLGKHFHENSGGWAFGPISGSIFLLFCFDKPLPKF